MTTTATPYSEDYNESWSHLVRTHSWDWMTAEKQLGVHLSLNLYRQLATGKPDTGQTNPEAVAVFALMEASYRDYLRQVQDYQGALTEYTRKNTELQAAVESFGWAFVRASGVEVERRDIKEYNRLNMLEVTTIPTMLRSPTSSPRSPPCRPISFGNVFFNSQTIDVSIRDNGSVNIGTMQLINNSDGLIQERTDKSATAHDLAVASEMARHRTALRHIAEIQNDNRINLRAESLTISNRAAEIRQMNVAYAQMRELGAAELAYRKMLPSYKSREPAFMVAYERDAANQERILSSLRDAIAHDSAQLDASSTAYYARQKSYDAMIAKQVDDESQHHYQTLREIPSEPIEVPVDPLPAPTDAPGTPDASVTPTPHAAPSTNRTLLMTAAAVVALMLVA
ncbi:hypothetical protein PAPYR_12171 [Paratrimastix pyriformis]|uniref:Uncharacterized protein n=1 Tax=Paratrimastix pyriformis TaxID=342808 RepID=A0ABQ8U5Z6_9EUKA|nr:hypothetical protein PAPYR_12171 [Paratrimastix pyriformis]